MKSTTTRYLTLWFLFFGLLFSNTVAPLKIERYYPRSDYNDISVCARVDRYFSATNSAAAKPYVKVIPKQYFKLSLSYDEICISGLKPQTEYSITIDKNIPLGAVHLDKTYTFVQKTGDYEPSFTFKDNGYILPAKGDISIPIELMNVDKLSVTLYRINRNNLIGAINRYDLKEEISSYSLDDIKNRDGYILWKKKLPIKYKKNVSKTVAIPVGKYLKKLEPGVYILAATTIDKDGEEDSYDTVTQWFMVSDIGLFTLKDSTGLHIYTKHLSNSAKYKNVKLELVSKNNEVLATTEAKDGYGFFKKEFLGGKLGLTPKAIYAYGKNGDFTVLNLSAPALDLTDRGVAGREAPKNYDGFIYSNRGIFKPGESVPFNLLLRDELGNVIKGAKLSLKLLDSRGVEVSKRVVTTNNLGYVGGEFKTSKSAEVGKWSIIAYAGASEPVAKLGFLIEDFVPPKIEVNLISKPKELKPNILSTIKAEARYLTGDVLPKPEGKFTVILHKAKTPFKEFKKYYFGKIDDSFQNDYIIEEDFTGDDNGTIELPIKLSQKASTSLPVSAYVKVSVNEPGGRPVNKSFNIFYNDKSGYIGLKPQFEYDSVDLKNNPNFLLVYIKDNKPIAKKINYRLIEEEVEWNWRSGDSGWEYYRTYSDIGEISKGDIDIQAHPTPFKLQKLNWGSYRLELSDSDGIITTYRFSVGYEIGSSKASPDRLPIKTDKKSYRLGDTLKVNITPKFSGPMLVQIANSRIIETKELNATEGKALVVNFKVKSKWGSSAYVLATAFRSQDKKLGATRAIGVAHIAIKDPKRYIELKIDAPKRVKSNSKLKVLLKAKKALKKPMFVTLAVVDKGILNITKYSTPNPAKYFWGQKKLGVEIRDVYADLIKAVGEHAEFEVGAGDEIEEGLNEDVTTNKRKILALISKPVAFKNGKAVIEFDIPNFQGSLKLMAVAWSKDGVGSSDSLVIVKDPISIEAYMPRFLASSDVAQIKIGAIFDKTKVKKGEYIFKIHTTGGIEAEKEEIKFNYDGTENMLESLAIKANSIKDGNITIETTKNGKTLAKREFSLAVRSPYPQTYVKRVGILDKGAKLSVKSLIDASKWQIIDRLRLKVTANALLPIASIERELRDYCCRCAEQTTSRAFPYLDKKTSYAKELIKGAIERLQSLQKIDGSFGLWSSSKASTWVSAYVLDFLTRAKAKGYKVGDKNINEGLKWLQNSLYRWSSKPSKQEADAYALYVLARNGKILMSEINFHVQNPKTLIKSGFAWGHLAAALAIVGEKQKAKEVFERAKKSLGNINYWSNYGGILRDKAALIVLLTEAGFKAMAEPLYVDLALDLKDRKYLSTQEMSQILRASKSIEIKPSKLKLLVGNKLYESKKALIIDAKSLNKIPEITNKSDNSVWYSLGFVGTPTATAYSQADNHGFSVTKEFFDIYGAKLDATQIAKNSRVVVVISGDIEDSAIERVIVMDFLPSGFELENPHISGVDEVSALSWLKNLSATEHTAYRDDRYVASIYKDNTNKFKVAYIARAVTLGKYTLPPVLVEDMYKPRYIAFSKFATKKLEIKNKSDIHTLPPVDTNSSDSNNSVTLTSSDYTRLMVNRVGDLKKYDIVQLNHLRNGIFAQIGLDFSKTNPALDNLFKRFDWYKPTITSGSVAYNKLSKLQKDNVQALLKEEKRRCGGNLTLADFYRVKVKALTAEYLKRYSKKDLRILRNSLIARYGFVFKDAKLNEIFSYMPWYKPNPDITASEIIDKKMSDIERANIQTILKVEHESK